MSRTMTMNRVTCFYRPLLNNDMKWLNLRFSTEKINPKDKLSILEFLTEFCIHVSNSGL